MEHMVSNRVWNIWYRFVYGCEMLSCMKQMVLNCVWWGGARSCMVPMVSNRIWL